MGTIFIGPDAFERFAEHNFAEAYRRSPEVCEVCNEGIEGLKYVALRESDTGTLQEIRPRPDVSGAAKPQTKGTKAW
jgi:hypothetical protein